MENSTPPDPTGKATAGFVLGILGLLFWLIPLFGLPVTIVGIVLSAQGLKSTRRPLAIAGLTLSIIGLALTCINGAIGAFLALTGRHPIVNRLFHR